MFINGSFSAQKSEVSLFRADSEHFPYEQLLERYRPVPLNSIGVSWPILEFLKVVRDKYGITNLNELFSRAEMSLKSVESVLRQYSSSDNDYITMDDLNQWCKSFDLVQLESDISSGKYPDFHMDVNLVQNGRYWIDRNILVPDDGSPYIAREWSIAFEGQYSGDGIVSGTQYYTDGSKYVGHFQGHKPHGQGKLFDNRGLVVYVGDFRDGLPDGSGVSYSYGPIENNFADITVQKGSFYHGKIHGNDCYEYRFGAYVTDDIQSVLFSEMQLKFKGSFKNGLKHGFGIEYVSFTGSNGVETKEDFKGEYVEGKRYKGIYNGKKMLYSEYSAEVPVDFKFEDGSYYQGDLQFLPNPVPSGKGKKFNSSGQLIYSGAFMTGLYHGSGSLYQYECLDGDLFNVIRYKGQFIKGQMDGQIRISYRENVPKKLLLEYLKDGSGWIDSDVVEYRFGTRYTETMSKTKHKDSRR